MASILDGSCPVCMLGEVENNKCGRCKVEFCPKCGKIVGRGPDNWDKCSCDKKKGKKKKHEVVRS